VSHNAPHSSPAAEAPRTRRSLFAWLAWLTAVVAAIVFLVPFVLYIAGALKRRRDPWVELGPVKDFPLNEYRLTRLPGGNPLGQKWDGMTANTEVFVRYLGKDAENRDRFVVFAVNCAHLGCPVSWFPQSGLFMCPCHGGVYYENGDRASGPPPRGLYPCPWKVDPDKGTLSVLAPHLPTLQDTLEHPA
jgi:Rieske Fe-S protein